MSHIVYEYLIYPGVGLSKLMILVQPRSGGNGTDAQNSSASNPYPNMPNIPNMQIDQNTGKCRQVTESEHISVIEKYVEAKNYGQNAR